jgi:hypothetical protein
MGVIGSSLPSCRDPRVPWQRVAAVLACLVGLDHKTVRIEALTRNRTLPPSICVRGAWWFS